MKVPKDVKKELMDHVENEIDRIHHGKVTVELNETQKKVYVVSESRERFKEEDIIKKTMKFKEKDAPREG